MKYCNKCGARLEDDDLFCMKCGNKVGNVITKTNNTKDTALIKESLVNYLDGARELEVKKYSIEQLKNSINQEIRNVQDRMGTCISSINRNNTQINNLKNQMASYKEREFEDRSFEPFWGFSSLTDWPLYIFFIFINVVAFYAIGIYTSIVLDSMLYTNMFMFFRDAGAGVTLFVIAVFLLGTPFVEVCICNGLRSSSRAKKKKAEYEKEKAEFLIREQQSKARFFDDQNKKIQNILSCNSDLDKEVTYIKRVSLPELNLYLQQVETALHNQNAVLDKYYSADIIYPKYRDLIPVATMYEYLKSGRVNRLTGAAGAYNLWENEVRLDVIINRLEQLIDIGNKTYASQNILIQSVNSVNREVNRLNTDMKEISGRNQRNSDQIMKGIKQIERCSELTNHYARIADDNLRQLEYYEKAKHNYLEYSNWY